MGARIRKDIWYVEYWSFWPVLNTYPYKKQWAVICPAEC